MTAGQRKPHRKATLLSVEMVTSNQVASVSSAHRPPAQREILARL